MKRYDLLIIGSGAGGSVAAKYAARLGARVAIVEKSENTIRGEDVLSGSVPSKALIYAADQPGMKWRSAHAHINKVTRQIEKQYNPVGIYKELGIDVLYGEAKFVGERELLVSGKRYGAKRIIIATGSEPRVPNIRGLKTVGFQTNKTIFSLSKLPKRLAIIGGGPIGTELAFALNKFGVSVTLIDHNPHLIKMLDADIAEQITDSLLAQGVKVYTSASVTDITATKRAKTVSLKCGDGSKKVTVDDILIAAGRMPRVPKGAKKAGIIVHNGQGIEVNNCWQTTNKRIYAIGDVTDFDHRYTHVASAAATQAVTHAFFRTKPRRDLRTLPLAFFTDPEVAHVGKTELDLIKDGATYEVYTMSYNEIDKATAFSHEGSIKVTVNKHGVIVGATILGQSASELIGYFAEAVRWRRKLSSLTDLALPYPTLSYGIHQLAIEANVDTLQKSKLFLRLLRAARI